MAPQIAWIGLGNMGRVRIAGRDACPIPRPGLTGPQGMCKNLVEKGNLDKPLILCT